MINKAFVLLVVVVAVLIAALLAILRVLGSITDSQLMDVGWKTAVVLLVVLVAGLAIGALSKPKQ
jgi:hypothetical protein